ncbi:PEP-CTERM sorting domain-containing protein [Tautonia sp. JC769]|uniref:PEP-CTERM sorting domain-containing protein n=2 Tax=Planctomycetia TaxID=203683 RepID=UPI00345ACEFC
MDWLSVTRRDVRTWGSVAVAALALAACPMARADSIVLSTDLDSRTEGLGSFEGTFRFSALDDQNASLIIELTNTIDTSIGGYLTRFVFNNPGGAISGLTLTAAPDHFDASLGNNAYGLEPFGRFDIEVGIGNGRPQRGLAAGQSGRFEFALTGSGFDGLTASSFLETLSVPPGSGEGLRGFVTRFQSIPLGAGSDKVPALFELPGDAVNVVPIPEPASVLSMAMGLAGVGWMVRRRASRMRRATRRRDRPGLARRIGALCIGASRVEGRLRPPRPDSPDFVSWSDRDSPMPPGLAPVTRSAAGQSHAPVQPPGHPNQLGMAVRQAAAGQSPRLVEDVQDPIEDRKAGASPSPLEVEDRLGRASPGGGEDDRPDDPGPGRGRGRIGRRRARELLGGMLGRERRRDTRSAETREHNDLLSEVGIAVGHHARNFSIVDLRTQEKSR